MCIETIRKLLYFITSVQQLRAIEIRFLAFVFTSYLKNIFSLLCLCVRLHSVHGCWMSRSGGE